MHFVVQEILVAKDLNGFLVQHMLEVQGVFLVEIFTLNCAGTSVYVTLHDGFAFAENARVDRVPQDVKVYNLVLVTLSLLNEVLESDRLRPP